VNNQGFDFMHTHKHRQAYVITGEVIIAVKIPIITGLVLFMDLCRCSRL